MPAELTADEILHLLTLAPNATCGFARQSFLSPHTIAADGVPAPSTKLTPV
jgi:hypothetical protein